MNKTQHVAAGMGVLQTMALCAGYWAFVTDPGWIEIGRTDWRWPLVLAAALIGGILVPGIALLLAARQKASVPMRIFWATDMAGFAAWLLWASQYG